MPAVAGSNAGYGWNAASSTFQACALGYYNPAVATTHDQACTICSTGTTTIAVGQSSCNSEWSQNDDNDYPHDTSGAGAY